MPAENGETHLSIHLVEWIDIRQYIIYYGSSFVFFTLLRSQLRSHSPPLFVFCKWDKIRLISYHISCPNIGRFNHFHPKQYQLTTISGCVETLLLQCRPHGIQFPFVVPAKRNVTSWHTIFLHQYFLPSLLIRITFLSFSLQIYICNLYLTYFSFFFFILLVALGQTS